MRRGRNGLSFYQRKKKMSQEHVTEAISWIFVLVLAVVLAFFFVYTLGMKTTVIGSSMEESLHNGQIIYMNRLVYSFVAPSRGDVVVFRPNGNENAHYSIKRVVGVPGDRIVIENGQLVVNGEVKEDMFEDKIAEAGIADSEVVLGDDEFFVMGDNVNNSEDSRSANLGKVMRSHIIGKAWLHMAMGEEGIGKIK